MSEEVNSIIKFYLRALGPAIGGSIGIMFTVSVLHRLFSSSSEFYHCHEKVANTVSVGTYTIGFATSVSDLMQVILILCFKDPFVEINSWKSKYIILKFQR